jgi:hypothetical protein
MAKSEEPVLLLSTYLKFDEYEIQTDAKDPGKEDVYFLIKVAKLIPKTPDKLADVDAGLIATYCLAAIQTANVKFSRALMWQRLRKVELDSVLGRLIRDSSKAEGDKKVPVTIAEKSAKADPEYEKAATLHGLAESYVEFYKNMLENFRATHYWARAQETEERNENKMGGYEPHELNVKGGRSRQDKVGPNGDVDLGG